MSDIKLFRLQSGSATELQGDASDLEKPLGNLIEANLDVLLGIRFPGHRVLDRQDARRAHRHAGAG